MTTATRPEARTTAGAVRGAQEGDLAVFRGIPFAEPRARFGAPEPAASWTDVREAVELGPAPPQSGLTGADAWAGPDDGWLTVNVWSPDLSGRSPVMVWIHGGGYVFGTSGLPEYDGARLARDGVVVVTFNYRVGAEGFAQVPGAPANRGLLDQVAALAWVQDNIAAFGGDPDQVTVFGQSAGGGSVAALLAMPAAAGLFRRAVVQSMPGTFFTPELAADVTRVLAGELGVDATDLADVSPADLALGGDLLLADAGQHADRWGLPAHRSVPFAPVVDGTTLPVDPWRALVAGAAADVDLVVGHVRHEQRLFALMEGLLGQLTDEQAAAALALFAPAPDGPDRYRRGGGDAGDLYDRVHSDWLFRMPSLHLAEAHTGTTYLYELTWPAPAMGGLIGACHGLDVPLVFGNLTVGQPAGLFGDDLAEAEVVSAQMRHAWTRFAIEGTPGWSSYDLEGRVTRVFDVEPSDEPYPEEASRSIWQDHVFAPLPLLDA